MKKILALILIATFSLSISAQDKNDKDFYYYDGIENRSDYNISSSQRQQIIQIKKGIGRRYAAIGKDRSLSGYEKGQKKRELSKQIRKEIYDVLNSDQRSNWDKSRSSSSASVGSFNKFNQDVDRIERNIDDLERRIDDMEDAYDRRIDAVENDYTLSKSERKYRKQQLKDEKNAKKREMKNEKQRLKDSRYY